VNHVLLSTVSREIRSDALFRYALLMDLKLAGVFHIDRRAVIAMRIDAAGKMLAAKMTRPEARQALQERFGVSRRTAYNLIDSALRARAPAVKQSELFA
jgi:hypothetical protein